MSPNRRSSLVSRALMQVVFASMGLAMVLLLGCIFHYEGAFFALNTHLDTLWWLAGYGVLACGMTVVIITGGIDLSVGSIVALVGVVFASLVVMKELPAWQAIPLGIGLGALCGLVSGVLVGLCGLQPFIATLAMMAFTRGLAKYICQVLKDGGKIAVPTGTPGIELLNRRIMITDDAGVSISVFILLACVVITLFLLRLTPLGMRVYAVGDNEVAARVSGLPVRRTKILAYTYCGAMAGIAGVIFGALLRQGDPDSGVGYELTAIAMVVIGGTSLAGGRGGVLLTLLGVLTIGYLKKVQDLNGISTAFQYMITGTIIVVAVLLRSFPFGGRRSSV